jgi:hypothetical protein
MPPKSTVKIPADNMYAQHWKSISLPCGERLGEWEFKKEAGKIPTSEITIKILLFTVPPLS